MSETISVEPTHHEQERPAGFPVCPVCGRESKEGLGALVASLPDTNRRAAFHPTDARLLAARSKDKRSILVFELALK